MGYKTRFNIYYATPKKKQYQTNLQMNMTTQEEKLWARIKSRQLGVTFVTQKIILGYIVDFYCQKYKLAIEIDGNGHDPEKDKKRTLSLNEVGVYVLRFHNDQITGAIEDVILRIKNKIEHAEKMYSERIKKKRVKYQYPRLG